MRPTITAFLAAAMVLAACAACGGRHTAPRDGGPDGESDVGADADGDIDVDDGGRDIDEPHADADEEDGEVTDADGDADVDADAEWDPDDTTWLAHSDVGRTEIYGIEPLAGGDVLVAGRYAGGGWIARLDPAGEAVWRRDDIGAGTVNDMDLGPEGRVFVTAGAGLAELDLDGTVIWQADVLPLPARVVALDDGTLVAVDGRSLELMRYSTEEGILWRRRVRGVSDDLWGLTGLAVSTEGTIYVAQTTVTYPGVVLLALDVEGEVLWSEVVTGWRVQNAAASEDGGVVLTGNDDGMWLAKLDRDGALEWSFTVGQHEPGAIDDACVPFCAVEEGLAVAVGETGEVMAVGYSTSTNAVTGGAPYPDIMALWADRDGGLIRAVAIADPSTPDGLEGYGTAAAAVPGGGWLVGGGTFGPRSAEGGVVARLDADGTVGGACDWIVPYDFTPRSSGTRVEPLDVTLEEGTFTVTPVEVWYDGGGPAFSRVCE